MGNTIITGKPVAFIVAHTVESQLAREIIANYWLFTMYKHDWVVEFRTTDNKIKIQLAIMARIELGAFRLQFQNSNHLTKLPSAVLLAVREEWRTYTC